MHRMERRGYNGAGDVLILFAIPKRQEGSHWGLEMPIKLLIRAEETHRLTVGGRVLQAKAGLLNACAVLES